MGQRIFRTIVNETTVYSAKRKNKTKNPNWETIASSLNLVKCRKLQLWLINKSNNNQISNEGKYNWS